MNPDYQVDRLVRKWRFFGRILTLVMLMLVAWALLLKIAEASERRAMQATREHLAASLTALAAERTAQGRRGEPGWMRRNPFVLLRWQQDNYCGELRGADQPRPGCWYWLPRQAWVLYRFEHGSWSRTGDAMRAWRLVAIPQTGSATTQALELEEIHQAELTAAGF